MPRKGTPRKPGVTPRYATSNERSMLLDPILKLTSKQIRFIELMGAGADQHAAAQQAGFRSRSARYKTLSNPLAIQYLSAIRAETRAITAYDAATAMAEALDVITFAKENKNAMAYCKAVELRARLSGLLIDRVEVVTVDLTGALRAAETRVLQSSASMHPIQATAQAQPES